jgi:2-methylcitrate dehydratase PrpD
VHASAPVAPVALVLAAEAGLSVGAALDAYAAGFEATAAFARAGHPALYEAGWHPTAVCGSAGAAVAAARLLGLSEARTGDAVALALLRAAGLRSAFGSDGKALQVGMAAAAGMHAASLAEAGARVPLEAVSRGAAGFEHVFGVAWPARAAAPAFAENWIKAYPCCLATHAVIEAALAVRAGAGEIEAAAVTVHPLARAAASLDDVRDGLQAKFSIPYLAAFALLRGAPRVADFDRLDQEVRDLARRIEVCTDAGLPQMGARVAVDGLAPARVEHPLGSPGRPMDAQALHDKLAALAGNRLEGVLDDRSTPAADVLTAAGLR